MYEKFISYYDTTYNQRINITLLTEALCPGCQYFLITHLYPVVYKNFADYVSIEFVPYGNARIIDGKIQCQHGEPECRINKYQSCLIDSVARQDIYVPMMYCLEKKIRVSFLFIINTFTLVGVQGERPPPLPPRMDPNREKFLRPPPIHPYIYLRDES
ncbi:gamma interferon inducible lysosomal thiol reductase [Oesophagostomum dentatum]|uniref:Gamma interferon inducible lysosomal thiol reductase n=1 Tax=Oesophagostomum dentatum TaxID=61180 RepID=A0A0B1TH17_OESDE|nr:gamma interferon inducible lysosomal thiol reductase [Oesophagostomum dentatum]